MSDEDGVQKDTGERKKERGQKEKERGSPEREREIVSEREIDRERQSNGGSGRGHVIVDFLM